MCGWGDAISMAFYLVLEWCFIFNTEIANQLIEFRGGNHAFFIQDLVLESIKSEDYFETEANTKYNEFPDLGMGRVTLGLIPKLYTYQSCGRI
jgi:hypothetical protein